MEKNIKEVNEYENEKIYKLSPSALSLMEECPRCFWLKFNEDKKRQEGIFPSLPSGMDKILKKHFDKFMKKGKFPPELAENKDCENLKLFDDELLLNKWRDAKKGLWIEDEEGNILHGGIDNILINIKNNKLVVLDYKTRGYPLKEDTHKHYQNQLDVYTFLLKECRYDTEDYAFLLFYVPKEVLETGEVIFDTTLKKIQIDVENAKAVWKKALDLLRGPCPKKHETINEYGETCAWCRLLNEE